MTRATRARRKDAARRRAENRSTGYEGTLLKIPDGLKFFEAKAGVHNVAILCYVVGKGNPNAEAGEEYYERTLFAHRNIGVEKKWYASLAKTFKKRCPIQEYREQLQKDPNADPELIKALAAKERQLFLLWDFDDPGLKIWEVSFYNFGQLLDTRVLNCPPNSGWDTFWFPEVGQGMNLAITLTENTTFANKFTEAKAIDFFPRTEPLPDAALNHDICLDDLIVEYPYEQLKKILLGEPTEEKENEKDPTDHAQVPADPPRDEDDPTAAVTTPQTSTSAPISEKAKTMPKAADFGIEKAGEVQYKGQICTVAKISPDGTSLTLLSASDEIFKAIAPEDVAVAVADVAADEIETVEMDGPAAEEAPFDSAPSSGDDTGAGDWMEFS